MLNPKMQLVRPMGVSLSKRPCVSSTITASFSPFAPDTRKGSLQTVMPVVMRTRPPRHSKDAGPPSPASPALLLPSTIFAPSSVNHASVTSPSPTRAAWRR